MAAVPPTSSEAPKTWIVRATGFVCEAEERLLDLNEEGEFPPECEASAELYREGRASRRGCCCSGEGALS